MAFCSFSFLPKPFKVLNVSSFSPCTIIHVAMITGANPAGAYSVSLFIVSDRPRKSIQLICYTAFHQPAALCDSSKSLLLFLIGLKHYLLVVKHNKPFWVNCQPLFLNFSSHNKAFVRRLCEWRRQTSLSSSLRVPRSSSEDGHIRGIPREPWFLLRYDHSYGTPIP